LSEDGAQGEGKMVVGQAVSIKTGKGQTIFNAKMRKRDRQGAAEGVGLKGETVWGRGAGHRWKVSSAAYRKSKVRDGKR